MTHRVTKAAILFAYLIPLPGYAGLIAHWKLDSTPADEAGSFPAAWDGDASYTPSVAAPASSAAADLSGAWLKAGTGIDFERTRAFSATAWIKGDGQDSSVVGDMIHLEGYQGWELHTGTTSYGGDSRSVTVWLAHDYPSSAIQVNATLPVLDNQWHHVAFTYDGSSSAAGVKIYIDGVEAAATASLDSLGDNIANGDGSELNIGTRMNGAHHGFTGAIDEVALFDHALTPAEMETVFNSGVEAVSFPAITGTFPNDGQTVGELAAAEVTFSLPVTGVDAGDLRVNGIPASGLEVTDSKHYRFTFPSPPQGIVEFSWAEPHGITGLNGSAARPEPWSAELAAVLPPAQVVISEFLARNAGGVEDEDHDTPDWIELLNPGSAAVDLGGWSLSDSPDPDVRWVLPSFTLQPGERRLIHASGKNRNDPAGNLHTDFRLSADGGYLALADPAGNVVHAFEDYPAQEANISLGLLTSGTPADGRPAWRYLPPTPGSQGFAQFYSGAALAGLGFSPAAPLPGEPITVTLRTAPGMPADTPPTLRYRIMYGAESLIDFADDGLHGDGAAGDHLWGAIIPAGATTGQMVRWRVSLRSNGIITRWPLNQAANTSLPLYEGTVVGSPDGGLMPVYQVFAQNYVFPTGSSQSGVDSDAGARAAFHANGTLYDNVLVRIKGTTSRYLFKRSHRVDFNPGREFKWSPDLPAQRELNLNSEYNDPSYLRQNQQLWMHRDSGGSGAPHFPVKLLMNGETWQLAFHTYSADSELVETMGLDPRGALYKQVGTLNTSSNPEKKSRRWESNDDYVDLREGIASYASTAAKSLYVHDNFNLPAVINYLAVARIAQEGDDVWANMVVYRDSEGTGEWQPIPFDLNLSFGQLFYGGNSTNQTVHATNDFNKSHPLYGTSTCLPNTGLTTSWNRLYEAIIQNPVTRAMLLRRIRTLMDRYLATSAATSPLESNFDTLGAMIGPEADIDRARWGLPPDSGAYGLGPGISPAQGLATLKYDFLAPRRTHFYTTHSINNPDRITGVRNHHKAGIPDSQSAAPTVNFGAIEAHPVSGNQDEEFIELVNPGSTGVDVSDWVIRSTGGSFKMKGGTVIPPGGSLHISPDVVAFRARATSPKRNENRFVVGPFKGHLSPFGDTLRLENPAGSVIATTQIAADPGATPVHLTVTEILSSSVHGPDNEINGDWWELTNTDSAPLDLTGFSWDDSRDLPGQAVFPPLVLAAGESIVILDEDDDSEAARFREAWGLPAGARILTREDFNLPAGFRGLGNGDSVIVYLPDGTQVTRSDYPAQLAGISRAWFRDGGAVPGGYSQAGKFAAIHSDRSPADLASPGFAAPDPATLTEPYELWTAGHDLWSTGADPAADPDGDGRDNRSEYVFGGLPDVADAPPPQSMTRSGGFLEWTFTHRGNDPSLEIGLESSQDLLDWDELILTPVFQAPHPTLPGYLESTYRITPGDDPLFLRARRN